MYILQMSFKERREINQSSITLDKKDFFFKFTTLYIIQNFILKKYMYDDKRTKLIDN